mmetsp:Transcript_31000/g.51389  ORF Transcript_31000/g.51389 Transcript_31000/m.51389 type:complete len:321 (+) Transcript_31000:79-1041(+)
MTAVVTMLLPFADVELLENVPSYVPSADNMWDFNRIRQSTFTTTLDGVMGGQSSGAATFATTLDGVMGGQSMGGASRATGNKGLVLTGTVNTNGGGFVSYSRRGLVDLSGTSGLLFEAEAVTGQSSPLALAIGLSTGNGWPPRSCTTLDGAIALPVHSYGQRTTFFLSYDEMELQRFWWWSWCPGFDFSRVRDISIRNVYQAGSFKVTLYSMKAVKKAPAYPYSWVKLPQWWSPRALLSAAIKRGDYLESKEGGYYKMSYNVYRTAALQVVLSSGSVGSYVRGVLWNAVQKATRDAPTRSDWRVARELKGSLKWALQFVW